MERKAKPLPEGYHTVTPYLITDNANEAIAFYKRVFGAKEITRMQSSDGKQVLHAELRIGDSLLFISDEAPKGYCRSPRALGAASGLVFLYVDNVDELVGKAAAEGAQVTMSPEDTMWGDRYGQFTDPFGQCWGVATHLEDVPAEEVERRWKEYQASART